MPSDKTSPEPSAKHAGHTEIDAWLAQTRLWTERELERGLSSSGPHPARLHDALRYVLFGGGKRLRPAIARLMCLHLGGADAAASAPAIAIECVHTYSLVHDDLPCMDDDELRRGRPTCHMVFGEALAVLAGDALLTLAFEVLSRAPRNAALMVEILARSSGPAGMVGGQVLDLEPPSSTSTRSRPQRELVEEIHRLKTAALFSAACEMGAVAAGREGDVRRAARDFGCLLGRCFQAVDDVLDVTGDERTLGKTPGKDARHAKPTLVASLGLEGARSEARHLAEEARNAARALPCQAGDLPLQLVDLLLARSA